MILDCDWVTRSNAHFLLVRSLSTASFPDEFPLDRSSKLPPAETFTFCLVTLLNDVATKHVINNDDTGVVQQVTNVNINY